MGDPSTPTSPPTYHNHSQDYNTYTSKSSLGPKSATTTKVVEAHEEDTKGYQSTSDDGRLKTTYEERTRLKHLKENVTTATLISGDDDDNVLKSKHYGSSTPASKSVPVIATETRKVAYTETKVSLFAKGSGFVFTIYCFICTAFIQVENVAEFERLHSTTAATICKH